MSKHIFWLRRRRVNMTTKCKDFHTNFHIQIKIFFITYFVSYRNYTGKLYEAVELLAISVISMTLFETKEVANTLTKHL